MYVVLKVFVFFFVLNSLLGHRRFSVSLPRAAASDDSYGYSPLVTEERDSVTVFEDSPAEKLSSDEIATSEVPKEEPVEDAPVVMLEDSPSASSATVEDSSSSAEKVAYNEIVTSEGPKEELKEEPVESAQEQAFELLNDFKVRTFIEAMCYLMSFCYLFFISTND